MLIFRQSFCLSLLFWLFSASSFYRKMDLKNLFLCCLLVIVAAICQTSGMPDFRRVRRSPQGPLSPWCNSPFLNYPFFTPRFCPPNPNCKLTIGREERDCEKLEWMTFMIYHKKIRLIFCCAFHPFLKWIFLSCNSRFKNFVAKQY